ncbi:hypothetical protein MKX03_012371, partial [Papaver bracteatum]
QESKETNPSSKEQDVVAFSAQNTDKNIKTDGNSREHFVAEHLNVIEEANSKQESKETNPSSKEQDVVAFSAQNTDKNIKTDGNSREHSAAGSVTTNDIPTLAFPPISTADFQFNHEKASDIIIEKVEEFLDKIGNGRLVLVDLTSGSRILNLVKVKAEQKNIDSSKFFTFFGDITHLYTKGGLHCNVIANAANWRLKPRGGGVNATIFNAAGPALEIATKEAAGDAGCIEPGIALTVPLPPTSQLHKREGVTHVIHVLGPNMNPQRPHCLNSDYDKGCKILREAYSSLFDCFASIRSKREGVFESDSNKKYKGPKVEIVVQQKSESTQRLTGDGTAKVWGSWAQLGVGLGRCRAPFPSNLLQNGHLVVAPNGSGAEA